VNSVIWIFSELFPQSFKGKDVKIPDGHQIVGFALKKDAKGNIIWLDLKTWKPPK
jgi:hypothetical protein